MTLSFAAWKQARVASTTQEAAVVRPKVVVKSEPVSPALVASLAQPDREGQPSTITFSPDGKVLLTGGHPTNVVQLWDVKTRKELRRIEVARGFAGSAGQPRMSPDWKTLYVPVISRRHQAVETDGKRSVRTVFSGEVRRWDLTNGKALAPLGPAEGHGPLFAWPTPAGDQVVCAEWPSHGHDTPPVQQTVLLTLKTGRRQALIDGQGTPHFSADGKFFILTANDFSARTAKVRRFELPSGQEVAKLDWADKERRYVSSALSPDGRVIAVTRYGQKGTGPEVRFLNAITFASRGRYVAAPSPGDHGWAKGGFTPDSKRYFILAPGVVELWDVAEQKVVRTIKLGRQANTWEHAVSADGRLLALGWLPIDELPARTLGADPRDLPQPRVTLINLKEEKIDRTLIAPHGHVGPLAFSPDGRALALGGLGAVHLFDLDKK